MDGLFDVHVVLVEVRETRNEQVGGGDFKVDDLLAYAERIQNLVGIVDCGYVGCGAWGIAQKGGVGIKTYNRAWVGETNRFDQAQAWVKTINEKFRLE